MKKIIASSFASVAAFALTNVTFVSAVTAGDVTSVTSAVSTIEVYLNLGVQLMVAAAVVWVIWNAFNFVLSAGDEEKRATSRSGIIYGVIGIVVMLSVWGLINLVLSSTGVSTQKGTNIVIPSIL